MQAIQRLHDGFVKNIQFKIDSIINHLRKSRGSCRPPGLMGAREDPGTLR
jgi:hypothetical protein